MRLFVLLSLSLFFVMNASAFASPVIPLPDGKQMTSGNTGQCKNVPSGKCDEKSCAKDNETVSEGQSEASGGKPNSKNGSLVDNIYANHHHIARDYEVGQGGAGCAPCGGGSSQSNLMNLVIERRHRYRDITTGGSFGPGVYLNYDTRLDIYPDGQGVSISVFDPREFWPKLLKDGNGNSLDGHFTDTRNKSIRSATLFDGNGQPLAGNLSQARTVTVESYAGYKSHFEVIGLSALNSTEDLAGNAPWRFGDVGRIAWPGKTTFNSGTFEIEGAGRNIGDNRCEFQFAHRVLSGDGTIVGRIASFNAIRSNSKVGVMIRETLSAESRMAIMMSRGNTHARFQNRKQVGGSNQSSETSGFAAPLWVKLTRTGDTITGFYSTDGVTWTQQGTTTISGLASDVFIGLAITSHEDGVLADATIDNVALTGSLPVNQATWPADNFDRVLAGRLKRFEDRNGYGTELSYKYNPDWHPDTDAAQQSAIDISPERQWQIDTAKDAYGKQASFTYLPDQRRGNWVISEINLPNGETLTYSYADDNDPDLYKAGQIVGVAHPDGTASTFAYGMEPVNQTSTITYSDAGASGVHRRKTAYLSTTAFLSSDFNEEVAEVVNQASLLIRMIANGEDEVTYLNFENPNHVSNNENVIYEGQGKLYRLHAMWETRYYEDGWTITDPSLGFAGISGSLESTRQKRPVNHTAHKQGTHNKLTDSQGRVYTYQYDSDSYRTRTTYSDGSVEKWAYNQFKQVTRYEDRLGRVTQYTYDSRGNLTKREVGLVNTLVWNQSLPDVDSNPVDSQTAEYAVYRWRYYPQGHDSQFLLQTEYDANYPNINDDNTFDGDSSELNRTDYVYGALPGSGATGAGSKTYLVTKIEGKDDASDTQRAETTFTFDTSGRLFSSSDPMGRITTFYYDAKDRVIQTHYNDGSTDRLAYGEVSDTQDGLGATVDTSNLVVARQDRNGFVTRYIYDNQARAVKTIYASHRVPTADVINSANTDLKSLLIPGNEVIDPNIRIEEVCTYLDGTSLRASCTRAGEKTEYAYDYRQRLISTTTHPRVGKSLVTTTTYKDNLPFKSTDAYGRDSYNFYRSSDSALVRSVRSAVPDFTLASFSEVQTLQRDLALESQSANSGGGITAGSSRYAITDYRLDVEGQQLAVIDPRGIMSTSSFDSRGRVTGQVQAFGQALGTVNAPVVDTLLIGGFVTESDPKVRAQSETIYDANSNVIESRGPRYFDSSDTQAYQKANTLTEYTGRNLVKARIVAAGTGSATDETPSGATELLPRARETFTYYLDKRADSRTDYRGNLWKTLWHQCCGRLQGQVDPEGHGTVSNNDFAGNVTHTATVQSLDSELSTDPSGLLRITGAQNNGAHDVNDALTINESTTRYDERNRPVATTIWLQPLGYVDPNNVPIAGGPAPGIDPAVIDGSGDVVGLTTYYHYFESVNGDTGSFEVSLRNGPQAGQTISLADVITEMNADGIDLNLLETVNGYATVTENPEGELSVSVSDGNGRNVISAQVAVGAKTTKTVAVDTAGLASETTLAAGDVITWRTMHYDTVAAVTTGRFEGSTNSHTLKTVSRDSFDKESASYSDGLGRTIESEDELGNLSFSIYDNNGNPRKVRDANGVGQDCDLDLRGRDILCKDTHGDVTKTVYDANSNVINIEDGKGQTLAADTVYDARDRVIEKTSRLSVDDVTKFTYDKNSNQREIADADALKAAGGVFANADKTAYSYDTRNLKISTAYPGHNPASVVGDADYDLTMCTYDAAMRKLLQTDQKGDTQANLYDLANRLSERQYRTAAQSAVIGPDGIPTGSIASDIEGNAQADRDEFEYDLASRTTKAKKGRYINVIDYTYDDAGRMVSETITVNTSAGGGQSYVMLHDFDSDNRMTRCTYPDGSIKTNFFTDRDEVDKTFYQGNLVADMAYDAGYRETSRTFGNNLVTTKTYNADNTYSSITVAGKTGLSFDYTYDANKNVLTETTGAPMAGYSWNATYDAKDRLKTWSRTNALDSQSWDLSEVGDWKNSTDNGVTTARGHNAVHEIGNVGASSLSHDSKGNTTTDELGRVLNWDFENKLQSSDASSAGGSSSIDFTYDAVGRRISKDGTFYVYCGQKVCAEYDVGALAANPERKFIYGNYVDDPIMLVDADGAGADIDEYYYHCNRQYSVTGLTDDTGAVVERYAYTPYGQTTILAANGTATRTSSSYDNPYMYTGRRIDLEFSDDPETAMYYFRARYFSPTLGRFVGRDPLGYVDGYSLYAGYFASVCGVDSTGLGPVDHYGNPLPRPRKEEPGIHVTAVQPMELPQKCSINSGAVSVRWRFKLSGKHCEGYMVQRVSVNCSRQKCGKQNSQQENYIYYEAWKFGKNASDHENYYKWQNRYTDVAKYKIPSGCSNAKYEQKGDIRFYCLKDIAKYFKSGWVKGYSVGKVCPTGTAELLGASQTEGDKLWNTKLHLNSGLGSASRVMSVESSCCGAYDKNLMEAGKVGDAAYKWTHNSVKIEYDPK